MHKALIYFDMLRGEHERQMIYGLFIEITISPRRPRGIQRKSSCTFAKYCPAGNFDTQKIASVNVDILAFMHVALCFN